MTKFIFVLWFHFQFSIDVDGIVWRSFAPNANDRRRRSKKKNLFRRQTDRAMRKSIHAVFSHFHFHQSRLTLSCFFLQFASCRQSFSSNKKRRAFCFHFSERQMIHCLHFEFGINYLQQICLSRYCFSFSRTQRIIIFACLVRSIVDTMSTPFETFRTSSDFRSTFSFFGV